MLGLNIAMCLLGNPSRKLSKYKDQCDFQEDISGSLNFCVFDLVQAVTSWVQIKVDADLNAGLMQLTKILF